MSGTVHLGVRDITRSGDWGEYGPIRHIVDKDGNERNVNFVTELKSLKHSILHTIEKCGCCGYENPGSAWVLHVERGDSNQMGLACQGCNTFVWYGGEVNNE